MTCAWAQCIGSYFQDDTSNDGFREDCSSYGICPLYFSQGSLLVTASDVAGRWNKVSGGGEAQGHEAPLIY